MINSATIYLGSFSGNRPVFCETAFELGKQLANRGITVVYGGACVGTMKALSDGATSNRGRVIGIFPKGFKGKRENSERGIEVCNFSLNELIEVKDLSERKKLLAQYGDCCITLPGSYGTLDELFEHVSNTQLGIYNKPIYILNVEGYYNPLKQMISNMVDNGFIKEYGADSFIFCDTLEELLTHIDK